MLVNDFVDRRMLSQSILRKEIEMKRIRFGALCGGVLLLVTSVFGGSRTSASLTSSYGNSQKPPLNYAYVVITYSCSGKNIAVFSQVFGACYQETNHSRIASGQRDTFYQIAKASCGKDVVASDQRTSYPYQGSTAEDRANQDRDKDIRDYIRYGYKIENAWLQVPYYSRCS